MKSSLLAGTSGGTSQGPSY